MSLSASYAISAVFNGKDKLSPVINKIEKKYGSLAGTTARSINKMNKSINKMAKVGAVGLGAISVGIGLIVKEASKIEDATANFTPLMGSVEQAEKLVSELNKTAATTPFQFGDIAKTAQKLLPAMNGDIEKTVKTFRMLGDTAGGNASKLETVSSVFTRAILKNKIEVGDLNMLVSAGIPIYGELSKEMGVSQETMAKMVSKGQVSGKILEKTFQNMTSEGGVFYKGMDIASQTLTGVISTLKDNIALLAAKLGSTLLPYIKSGAKLFITIASSIGAFVEQNRDLIGQNIDKIFKKISTAMENIKPADIINGFKKFLNVFKAINAIVNKLGGWKKFATIILSVVAGVKALVLAMNAYNIAMSIHATIMKLVSLAEGVSLGTRLGLLGVTISTTVATIAYKVAAAASVVATYAMTAAQWALNVAMDANPIGLIILGVAALAALITLIIVKWDTWGETILGVMAIFSPAHAVILGIITVVKSLKDNWDSLASSFQSGGFINGIKTLGAVIFQAVLSPLLAVVKLLEKIPGVAKLGLSDKLTGLMDSNQDFIDRDNSTKNKEAEIRNRYALAPNGQKAETEQTKAVLGAGTITVKAEQGSSATVNNGSMKKTGWNMEELGKDGAA